MTLPPWDLEAPSRTPAAVRRMEGRIAALLRALWEQGVWVKRIKVSPSDLVALNAVYDRGPVRCSLMFFDPFFGYLPIVESESARSYLK